MILSSSFCMLYTSDALCAQSAVVKLAGLRFVLVIRTLQLATDDQVHATEADPRSSSRNCVPVPCLGNAESRGKHCMPCVPPAL